MGNYLVPVILGFTAGVAGYIIVRFWLRPVLAYLRVKRQIRKDLDYLQTIAVGETPAPEKMTDLRRHSVRLGDMATVELPYWYRLKLQSRREYPEKSAKLLMAIAQTRNLKPDDSRFEQIRGYLKL